MTEQSITDDNWPRHPDGRRKTFGEMTHAQKTAVVRGSVARLTPKFSTEGVALEFRANDK
jgi:hypothetical protein